MRIIIITGYGDRSDYLKPTLSRWRKQFGKEPEVHGFGWDGEATEYQDKWLSFCKEIEHSKEVGIIGISAGASVALRALQTFPNIVSRVVTVCGPLNTEYMSSEKIQDKYPLLEPALDALDLTQLPAERIMTCRPLIDEVVSVHAMQLEGAHDIRIKMVGHATSIAWGMFHHARDMHNFLQMTA